MNELLQKHGCSNVFTVPDGLKELMSDITREVLRWQPTKIFDFIANYLSALLITREHGIMAVKILDDLCDCKPSVSEHLLQIGLDKDQVDILATIIKTEIEGQAPVEGKEKVKETAILKKVLTRIALDEEMSAKVCQVARNAYRDYWYRKSLLKKGLKVEPEEAWEKAAQHTLEIYKKTKPSLSELHRATERIQAAYRGYHVRRNVLRHLMPEQKKKKKPGRKVGVPGPPLDVASSREIDLGPVINIKIREDDVSGMFEDEVEERLNLQYDPMKTITHKEDDEYLEQKSTKIQIGAPKLKLQVMQTSISRSSPLEAASRQSHLESQASAEKSKSYGMPTENVYVSPFPRISFAEAPPVVIAETIVEDALEQLEVDEMPGLSARPEEVPMFPPGAFEIPEELPDDADNFTATDIEDAGVDDEDEEEEE